MGYDIHSFAEKINKQTGKWEQLGNIFPSKYEEKIWTNSPFQWRHYKMYTFLANVRNYYKYDIISPPKGLPENSVHLNEPGENEYVEGDTIREELWNYPDYHSHSYLTVAELLAWDYDKPFLDKQSGVPDYSNTEDGIPTFTYSNTTWRKLLSDDFFQELELLKQQGNPEEVRIVFWFDN